MNKEEQAFLEEQESRIRLNQAQIESSQNNNLQYSTNEDNLGSSMMEEQLDLRKEKSMISHLLRGEIEGVDENGKEKWIPSNDPDMQILTEYGINLILNTISWYLNKNTLLSNYKEEMINAKMEDVATALADVIFMGYEKIFKYPTFEECQKVFAEKLEYKKKIRIFTLQLLGKEINDEEIDLSILKEFEGRIEHELGQIKEQLTKGKLKRYELIMRALQDTIHSAYQRAWNGQERRTLREHIHISENKGGIQQQPQQGGFFKEWSRAK